MSPIKIIFGDAEFEVNADTIGDLRAGIQKEFNEVDISDWNLFHFGLLLPKGDNVKIEDIAIDDQQLVLSLTSPPEPERYKQRKINTDKTRFLVKGTRSSFEIIEIKPGRPLPAKLKTSGLVKRAETFGIITNTSGEEGKRKIQLEQYQVSGDGNIDLQTDLVNGYDKVFLVQGEPPKSVELEPCDTKFYDEERIMTSKDSKTLWVRIVGAIFGGIAAVAGVVELAM